MNKKNSHIKSHTKSQRQLQIGEQIKRILADIFLQDDLFSSKDSYVTILQADISPDAKNAKIFIDIFGNIDGKKIAAELKQISPYLRSKLAAKINLRYTPELIFVIDGSGSEVNKIENLLAQEAKKFS